MKKSVCPERGTKKNIRAHDRIRTYHLPNIGVRSTTELRRTHGEMPYTRFIFETRTKPYPKHMFSLFTVCFFDIVLLGGSWVLESARRNKMG